MNSNSWTYLSKLLVVIFFVAVSGCVPSDQYEASQARIGELQKELDKVNREVIGKNQEISGLKDDLKAMGRDVGDKERELNQSLSQVRRLKGDIGIVGKCLRGVIELIEAGKNQDSAAVIIALTKLTEPCERSEKILEEVETTSTRRTDDVSY